MTKQIPLLRVFMSDAAPDAVAKTLRSGYVGQGPRVEEFEAALVPWVGRRGVTTHSGTTALTLALQLTGVGPGTEVIVSPMTCAASATPILNLGGRVKWADIDPTTGNIDPHDVVKQITHCTKAIIAVHWGGYPCELDELADIADHHGLALIEDAAHAFGSSYRDTPIGSHSRFVAFSFQAVKLLTTVDGGLLTCAHEDEYAKAKLLRWYGIDRDAPKPGADLRCEQDISVVGWKGHMNDVAASIGLANLARMDVVLATQRKNAKLYREELGELKTVALTERNTDRVSSDWLFTIFVRERDRFIAWMAERGVVASKVHARLDRHSVFAESLRPLPGVDAFWSRHVCIPVGWWLDEAEMNHVIDSVRAWDRLTRSP